MESRAVVFYLLDYYGNSLDIENVSYIIIRSLKEKVSWCTPLISTPSIPSSLTRGKHSPEFNVESPSWQTFSAKAQTVNIFNFVGQMVPNT